MDKCCNCKRPIKKVKIKKDKYKCRLELYATITVDANTPNEAKDLALMDINKKYDVKSCVVITQKVAKEEGRV